MTVPGPTNLYLSQIGAEYGVTHINLYLGQLHRGHASGYVRANGSGNAAVNHSAGVPATATNLMMGHFPGEGKGWTYTNSVQRINHYHCHSEFGDDWLGANGAGWPMFYINNNSLVSQGTSWYALVIYGRGNNGPFTFTNNHEIQGGGGVPNSGAGQHAIYIYNSVAGANRPIFVNNYAVRGGGGAGGKGGTGGTGGTGYTQYWVYEPASGYHYVNNGNVFTFNTGDHHWKISGNYSFVWNAGSGIQGSGSGSAEHTIAPYTYERGVYQGTAWLQGDPFDTPVEFYSIRRRSLANTYHSGAGGGAGGNGGRGIGYASANQGGSPGAGGGNAGNNTGVGGTGGTGGTGGSWGDNGDTGATGGTGAGGNAGGGYGGAAGAAGGAAGYSIYAASPWGFVNTNTIQGPYGGGVANS